MRAVVPVCLMDHNDPWNTLEHKQEHICKQIAYICAQNTIMHHAVVTFNHQFSKDCDIVLFSQSLKFEPNNNLQLLTINESQGHFFDYPTSGTQQVF